MDDVVQVSVGGSEWEELNTDVHAIDDYTMQIPAPYKAKPAHCVCVAALLAGLWRRQGSSSWTWHPLGQVLAERHIPHGVADEQREQIPLFLAAG